MAEEGCEDTRKANKEIKANTPEGCEECLKIGQQWVHLRLCLTCGHVGCCDSSIGKHATKHFNQTKHPVMADYPSRDWLWCYVHKTYGQ